MQFCKTNNLAFSHVIGTFAIFFGIALLTGMPARAAEGDALATTKEYPGIKIIPGDGINLTIEEVLNPYYIIVKVNPPVHNLFAGTFTQLPTDKDVTIGLSNEGMNIPGNQADVKKWRGLLPVLSYAVPTKEAYEWFQREKDGR